jgi:hypothetical protein
VPTTTDTFTCLTCTGCDPNGCLGQTCTRTCRANYAWSQNSECPIGNVVPCVCPDPTGPCDADHVGHEDLETCGPALGDCVGAPPCGYLCVPTGASWEETTSCPEGCLCTGTLATCDTDHISDTVTTACAEPTWA